ncbi:nucleoside phosphorylase [Chthonomonas calidirosea]|uniref:Nucleoside phosphorylase n=1 Tax=Chthonomonas calidirosea (strain DSM 23976 / ICMP 18418 / T49) TaxID=1303518 RepID=S0ESM0_CHTCT|nr:nucleoside phosphorylase [Chthonomonas calidirosea]CCW33900.1 Nucleoside phosphorylase [Chthonomonas calidirosea T49]CEK16334.1 nucleoside phosphorylase [Chthonomonas calidirosea]
MICERAQLRIGVLFALPQERKPFRPIEAAQQNLIVHCSGAGRENAARGAQQLLAQGAQYLIVCGFGGGLVEEVMPGTLLLADQVLDGAASSPQVYKPNVELFWQAQQVAPPQVCLQIGPLATVNRVLLNSAEKSAFLQKLSAIYPEKPLGIDMESFGAAQVAAAHNCPWIVVRAITDGHRDSMPFDFNVLTDTQGRIRPFPLLLAVLKQPQNLPELLLLGKRAANAAKMLALYLQNLVAVLQEPLP